MKHDDDPGIDPGIDLAGRLKDLEHFTGTLVRRRGDADSIPIAGATVTRIPVVRRTRVFLRGGGGHGVFAELTLAAPRPRAALD